MALKISLLKVSANASLLECKRATQEFITATDAVFFKAQGLATLAPLHKMAFGLLEGLLDNWRLLNLNSVEWPHKVEVRQACINLWSLNKQAPWCAFWKDDGDPSTLPLTQESSQWLAPRNKGKGKAKVTEDDKDKEGEATQKLRKELEDFMFDDKLLASLLLPPLEYYEGDIGVIVALPTIWLSNISIQLANVLAGAVVASPKAACGMA
ncbi:hypothetical protein C0995_000385 [Termitomyces sp. Mi166|nr:hypothetical protein C0995_000385 [Termitomyces sp. Mi166\